MSAFSRLRRRAFTLVEMLIAMALTLILVYAIAEFYAYVGETVKDGRAGIELDSQMRIAVSRLKADLELLTVPVVPWADGGSYRGYFEIGEGPRTDSDANANLLLDATEDVDSDGNFDFAQNNYSTMLGDIDDYLAFTIRSDGEPFTGFGYAIGPDGLPIYSTPVSYSAPQAEVIWWTSFIDQDGNNQWSPNEQRVLHRRQLLIDETLTDTVHPADTDFVFTDPMGNTHPIPYFMRLPVSNTAIYEGYMLFDVALEWRNVPSVPGYRYFFSRTGVDLTRREHRFMHAGGIMDLDAGWNVKDTTVPLSDPANSGSLQRWVQQGTRRGDDVVLTNLLGFDVRVFDPAAPLYADDATNPQSVLQPGDPAWLAAFGDQVSYPPVGRGAFVDLRYHRADGVLGPDANWNAFTGNVLTDDVSYFSPAPAAKSFLGTAGYHVGVYDNWSVSYERDGVNQDGGILDSGTDGLDNDGFNGVDDPGERETSPPYPYPLRGIQVKIRLYEPGTRQVRQATVGADFIQE